MDFQINSLLGLKTDVSDINKKLREHDDSLYDHQTSIEEIKKILDEMKNKMNEFENNFQEINFKLVNVDALNLFKRDNDENHSYGTEELTAMIITLEKKFNTKITFIDERFKKNEEELLKLRQLEKAIEETNKDLKLTNKNVEWIKEQLTIIFARLDDVKNHANNLNDTTNSSLKEGDEKIRNYFDQKFIEYFYIIYIE